MLQLNLQNILALFGIQSMMVLMGSLIKPEGSGQVKQELQWRNL